MTRSDPRPIGSIDLEAFILAGGRSSRFGSDKALASWQGKPLLVYAIDSLKGLGLTPRIVCRDPLPYLEHARVFVMSERPDHGPLEGIRIALRSASRELALILTADMPLVREGHLRQLIGAAVPDNVVVYVSGDGIRHPFPGIYPRSALPIIESLAVGSSVQALLDRIPLRMLPADSDTSPALRGVNTPDDLRGLSEVKETYSPRGE